MYILRNYRSQWLLCIVQLISPYLAILNETCGLDDVFLPDDLGSGPCTPFNICISHIIAAFLLLKYTLRDIHTKSWYGHAGVLDDLIPCGFRCAFGCMFQYSLCHVMDIGTRDIVHWSAAPHDYSQSDWFSAARCSSTECHQVLLSLFPR